MFVCQNPSKNPAMVTSQESILISNVLNLLSAMLRIHVQVNEEMLLVDQKSL